MWTRIQAACVLNYLVTVHGSVIFTRALGNNNGEHPQVFSQERTTVVCFQNNLLKLLKHYSDRDYPNLLELLTWLDQLLQQRRSFLPQRSMQHLFKLHCLALHSFGCIWRSTGPGNIPVLVNIQWKSLLWDNTKVGNYLLLCAAGLLQHFHVHSKITERCISGKLKVSIQSSESHFIFCQQMLSFRHCIYFHS